MPRGAGSVGVEIDSRSIRGVKIRTGKGGVPVIIALDEIAGSFDADDAIIEGLNALRKRIAVSFTDIVVTSVAGKLTYAAHLFFRRLPDDELKNALKFEIRKNLSYDTASSTIEYQFLDSSTKRNEPSPLIVASVAHTLLERYMRLFEKAGMPPAVIEVFPLTVANAFRAAWGKGEKGEECGEIILHIGPEFSTLVIDGNEPKVPFYNRTIYFPAFEIFDAAARAPLSPREVEQRVNTFTGEISRSLAYYQSTCRAAIGTSITLLGTYTPQELLDAIGKETRLAVERLDLAGELESKQNRPTAGRFDVAAVLALRGTEQ